MKLIFEKSLAYQPNLWILKIFVTEQNCWKHWRNFAKVIRTTRDCEENLNKVTVIYWKFHKVIMENSNLFWECLTQQVFRSLHDWRQWTRHCECCLIFCNRVQYLCICKVTYRICIFVLKYIVNVSRVYIMYIIFSIYEYFRVN